MPINTHFNYYTYTREQDLIEDLIIESIKMYGLDVMYMPRLLVKEDTLWGEDTLSTFDDWQPIEMYVKSVEGFEGDGDFLSKFNLEIRDQVTFTVARRSFDDALDDVITTEHGYSILQESGSTTTPSRRKTSDPVDNYSLLLESNTTIDRKRPMEGDLIHFPLNDKLYEIKFVEHEDIFYQMGRLQTFDLRCELFEYSSEIINTGNTAIDSIQDDWDQDVLDMVLYTEAEDTLLNEDGDPFLQEYSIDPVSDNDYLQAQGDSVIDFSESNPFSEVLRY